MITSRIIRVVGGSRWLHPSRDVVVMMAVAIDSEKLLIVVEVDEWVLCIGWLLSEIWRVNLFIGVTPHSNILRLTELSHILSIIYWSHNFCWVNASSRRASVFQQMCRCSHAGSYHISGSCVRIIHEILQLWGLYNDWLDLFNRFLLCWIQHILEQMIVLQGIRELRDFTWLGAILGWYL